MLEITGAAKSADEATRVMIYKNGKSSIYGKGQYKDRSKAETDCTKFVSDKEVYKTSTDEKQRLWFIKNVFYANETGLKILIIHKAVHIS